MDNTAQNPTATSPAAPMPEPTPVAQPSATITPVMPTNPIITPSADSANLPQSSSGPTASAQTPPVVQPAPKTGKPMIKLFAIAIIVALIIAVGGIFAIRSMQNTPTVTPIPTPLPTTIMQATPTAAMSNTGTDTSNTQLTKDSVSIDSTISSIDTNLNNVDLGLNDQQTNLQ